MSEVPPTALEARQLVKQYPGVLAVDGVSFCVPEGSCFGLLGPNGAGKTTTVETIEGVTRPTSGEVFYYGEIAGSRFRQETGIQFQNTALQDHLTVLETLKMFRALYERQADLAHVIEQCSLADLLDRDNRKLSGGGTILPGRLSKPVGRQWRRELPSISGVEPTMPLATMVRVTAC